MPVNGANFDPRLDALYRDGRELLGDAEWFDAHTHIGQNDPDGRKATAEEIISGLGWIARDAAELPNLFFDTAWWLVADHLQLYATIPPGQILYASDMPYGPGLSTAFIFLRVARAVGLQPEALRAIAGGQLARIIEGEDPLDLGPAPGAHAVGPRVIQTERVVSYAASAMQIAFRGLATTE